MYNNYLYDLSLKMFNNMILFDYKLYENQKNLELKIKELKKSNIDNNFKNIKEIKILTNKLINIKKDNNYNLVNMNINTIEKTSFKTIPDSETNIQILENFINKENILDNYKIKTPKNNLKIDKKLIDKCNNYLDNFIKNI